MDVDLNTLQYLTEPNMLNKLTKRDKASSIAKEISFYKKRIYLTTKRLLLNTKVDIPEDILIAFNNYAKQLIQHYKIIDTNDILQEEFKNIKEKTNNDDISSNKCSLIDICEQEEEFENINQLIMRQQPTNEEGTLKSFVKTVKCKSKVASPSIILPLKKNVNLKQKKLKNKR